MPSPSTPSIPPPTPDERRRAVIAAMAQAPGLIRFAARYTPSIEDAEDAYQRGMEVALQRAPVTEPREFLTWLQTVIKNEALMIARRARFEGPADHADVSTSFAELIGEDLGADAVAEWRERYRGLRSALNALTEAQRVCLMLKSAGVSHSEIAEMTGFSARKVERSIMEGRTALHGWDEKMERGDECARVLPALHRVAEDDASAREERAVARHVKTCPSCRAVLSRRRDSFQGLASLVPVGLLAGHMAAAGPTKGSGNEPSDCGKRHLHILRVRVRRHRTPLRRHQDPQGEPRLRPGDGVVFESHRRAEIPRRAGGWPRSDAGRGG